MRRIGLATIAIIEAAVVLAANGYLVIIFGVVICGGDGGEPNSDPGSPRGDYCDLFEDNQWLYLPAFAAAAAVTLVFGLIGARRDDGRRVLYAGLAGLALTVLLHLPEWTFEG